MNDTQRELLILLRELYNRSGYPSTIRELACASRRLNGHSISNIEDHLLVLERLGLVRRGGYGGARSWTVARHVATARINGRPWVGTVV